MDTVNFLPTAYAKTNGDFICIETYSGTNSKGRDPQGKQYLLTPDTSDELLGEAIVDALAHSRQLTDEEWGMYFDLEAEKASHTEWVNRLMERYGYKTRRELFKNMENCGIWQQDETIVFWPLMHTKLESWLRLKSQGIEDVIIPAKSLPSKIGASLRLAFERCA